MSGGGSYDPRTVESEIYRFWEEGGFFHAEPKPDKKPYVIDIPLPNVTGALHLGHALNNTLQDILIRHKRMCGYEALWMPGTDHAGIATQAVVERELKKKENKTRKDITRDELVARIWKWKEEYGGRILQQLRQMGCSLDWARTRFTLDEVCARAVYEVFFQWFKAGLIYRGTRLVNWDAFLQTAVADDEVIYETVKGHFWHYRYPILTSHEGAVAAGAPAGRSLPDNVTRVALAQAVGPDAKYGVDYLSIATTRPETMLGDTAVCVHPDDERYKHLIGRHCLLPLINRPIPIIADGELAKMEMGTGCVKVTPGHDPKDYACGLRHNLPMINILTPDGKIRDGFGPYSGLDRYEARKRVVTDLQALGLMEKIEPYETEVGHSDRSKTPIEPMLSEQWFVKMADLAEMAMEAVRDGRVRFFPERYARTYLDWLGEKRDWCISRQLWWGHRIPVWQVWGFEGTLPANVDPIEAMTSARDAAIKQLEQFLQDAGIEKDDYFVRRDDHETFRICARTALCRQALSALQGFKSSGEMKPFVPGREPHPWFIPGFPDSTDAAYAVFEKITQLEQDPDVLDTWFSSALWPFSTLGWPHDPNRDRQGADMAERGAAPSAGPLAHARGSDQASPTLADFNYFFPTSTLVTGRGIITLWVARMVMTSLYFTSRVPFHHVHIHPIIQDGQGRTMSKSLGNGVDPLDIIELYGTDALRFTMAQMDTETQDVRLPVKPVKLPLGGTGVPAGQCGTGVPAGQFRTVNSSEKFELGRNFCNKLWQAATGFVLPQLEARRHAGTEAPSEAEPRSHGATEPRREEWPRPLRADGLALEDRWILSRLAGCIAECDRRFAGYQISEVAGALYTFFWNDFCDWYVELVKPRLFGLRRGPQSEPQAQIESEAQAGDAAAIRGGDVASAPRGRRSVEGAASAEPTTAPRFDDSAAVARQVLAYVLDQALRLLHPIIPFITEELWRRLHERAPQRGITELRLAEKALITAAWPDVAAFTRDEQVERELAALQNVIRALRDTLARVNTSRAAAKAPAIGKLPHAVIRADQSVAARLVEQHAVIERLGRCAAIEIGTDVPKPPESATQVLPGVEVYVPLSGLMDLAAERTRLRQERNELLAHIERLTSKLANAGFVSKAPAAVVEQERQRLGEMKDRLATLERNMADIDG